MNDFYEKQRELYQVLFGAGGFMMDKTTPEDKRTIAALAATVEEMEALSDGLQRARTLVLERGDDARALSREVRRAIWLTGAARDLLIAAEDGSAAIRAAQSEFDEVNADLEKVGKSASKLAADLGRVTGVLDAVARLLKLIGG